MTTNAQPEHRARPIARDGWTRTHSGRLPCTSGLPTSTFNYLTRRRFVMRKSLLAIAALLALTPLAHAGTLFQDDFESGALNKSQSGATWGNSVNTSVTTTNPKDGGYALQFDYETTQNGIYAWTEQRFKLGTAHTDLWFSYDLYVPSNYYHRELSGQANNNKFLAIYRNPYTTPGFQINFSLEPNGSGGSDLTIHSYDNGREQGILHPSTGKNFITSSDLGRWMHLVAHVKVPTSSGSGDGVLQMWKDGTAVANFTNVTDYGGSGQNYIDEGYILGWANSGFAQHTVFQVDNFQVSDSPIGVSQTVPPAAPTGVHVVTQ